MTRSDLYPEIEPRVCGHLPVDGLHRLYWEESGSPAGLPVVFLHGGPGSGCSPTHRRFFDPEAWRIVLFDQRGAGRSMPPAETRDNTTQHLIADIEALRVHLGIERWLVFGGSWGSTLALAYGIRHPERCLGFVLRGIFLGSTAEIDWFMRGMGTFFPEAGRRFLEFLPEAERTDPLAAYLRRLRDADPAVHGPAAAVWSRYEAACSRLLPDEGGPSAGPSAGQMLALARLEAHYFESACFLAPGALLDGAARLRGLPGVIVQGRYDVICPPAYADSLARAWPEARYTVVPDAGHSVLEPGIRTALVGATDALKTQLMP